MKYIRKIVALLIGIVFFFFLVISLGIIFAVKNINVTLITYADEQTYEKSYNEAKSALSVFKGESLLFLNTDSIANTVKDSNYTVASCEKVFPCTVNVVLKERLETFAVAVGGLYSMYDSDGKFIRSSTENKNVNDGTPNVEFIGVPVERIVDIAAIASTFKESFKGMRSLVASISLDVNDEIEGRVQKLCFNLRCGLKIQIDNYTESTAEKISAVYTEFCKLTDRQKLSGTLRGYRIGGEEGIINADYSKI